MNFDELIEIVARGDEDDWIVTTCWSMGAQSFLNGAVEEGSCDAHAMRAAYRHDLSVGVAWGLEHLKDYNAPWAKVYPDTGVMSHYFDVFYNGMLIDRYLHVSVDGGRCVLPSPQPERVSEENDEYRYFVTKRARDIAWLENRLGHGVDEFSRYMEQAGIEVR